MNVIIFILTIMVIVIKMKIINNDGNNNEFLFPILAVLSNGSFQFGGRDYDYHTKSVFNISSNSSVTPSPVISTISDRGSQVTDGGGKKTIRENEDEKEEEEAASLNGDDPLTNTQRRSGSVRSLELYNGVNTVTGKLPESLASNSNSSFRDLFTTISVKLFIDIFSL